MAAFTAILLGGLCGGLIGYGFAETQCVDGCDTLAGVAGLVGAAVGAVGVGVVSVLACVPWAKGWSNRPPADDG